jgi:hypothetical protein
MFRRHYVVSKDTDGGMDLHPMKPWFRANPEYLPPGLDPDENTSHQIRRGLREAGWRQEDQADRVLLVRPEDKENPNLNEALASERDEDEEVFAAEEITFSLERDLQRALRSNIEQLEPGLKILDGGRERTTEAGRIDILAADAQGSLVIIELKAGEASPEAVTQILAYMGSLADSEKRSVRGILVAGDFHQRVLFASRAVSNLELRRYTFHFGFSKLS